MMGWEAAKRLFLLVIALLVLSIMVAHHFNDVMKWSTNNPTTALNYGQMDMTSRNRSVFARNIISPVEEEDDEMMLKYQKCKYPSIDPFDYVTMSYLDKEKKTYTCKMKRYSNIEEEVLRVRITDIKEVWLYYIIRVSESTSKLSEAIALYVNGRAPSDGRLKEEGTYVYYRVNEEFIKVTLTSTAGETWEEYHHVFLKPPNTEDNVNDRTNIIMLHLDGVSDANVKRQLKKTYAYLKDHKHTVIFNQHSIIGDGTTANMIPILTGHLVTELPEARKAMPKGRLVDNWPFIYKEMHKLKYRTWFMEDQGAMFGTFHYRLRGFKNPPVTHYYRPLWMILDSIMAKQPSCGAKFHIEHLKQYYKTFRNYNKFSLHIFSYLTHDNPSWLFNYDEDLHGFYNYMEKEGHMNNTVFILYGDHGNRASSFRSTLQGTIEERFPFLGITVPPWFEEHKELMKNLRWNKDVLTSHFDLYSTLQHILTFPRRTRKTATKHGVSLFRTDLRKLNRTCADVSVKPHYCLCFNMLENVGADDAVATQAVEEVVAYMNEENEKYARGLCAQLSLKTFVRATKEKALRGVINIQVKFVVSPSNGLFEASITCDGAGKQISNCGPPEISRTNRYGSQPHCISEIAPLLAKYCYCKDYNGKPSEVGEAL